MTESAPLTDAATGRDRHTITVTESIHVDRSPEAVFDCTRDQGLLARDPCAAHSSLERPWNASVGRSRPLTGVA